MKLLMESTDEVMLMERAALLRSRGVPVHLDQAAYPGVVPGHLYVVFDRHHDDARRLLQDSSHTVAQPVFEEEFEGISAEMRDLRLSLGSGSLENLLLGVAVLMTVFFVASRVFEPAQ